MSKFLTDLAQQGLGAIFGIGAGAYNDNRQYNQQERLQGLQIKGSKELTDYQIMKQFEMWQKTNYGAQMAELRKAGLNPALLYGMGGQGGMTTGGGAAQVAGAQAQQGGGGEFGMGLQMTTLPEQKRLMKAQAENLEADTQNKTGVVRQEAGARISLLGAEYTNKVAEAELKQLDKYMNEIRNAWTKETYENGRNPILYNALKAMNEADILGNEADVSDETKLDTIAKIKAEAIGAVLANDVMRQQMAESKSKIKLNDQQIEGIKSQIDLNKEQITNWIRENERKWAELDFNGIRESLKSMPGGEKVDWEGITGNIIEGIILRRALGGKAPAPVRGFHNR